MGTLRVTVSKESRNYFRLTVTVHAIITIGIRAKQMQGQRLFAQVCYQQALRMLEMLGCRA